MKKILLYLLLLFSAAASAQYTPNSGAYSYKGLMPLKSLQLPTGCGYPSTLINSPDSSRSAIYFDSCNAIIYRFNPKPKTWSPILDSGAGGVTVDSVFISSIDSIFISNTDSIFIISGNDTIFIGMDNQIRDTASLTAQFPLMITNDNGVYKPNGFDLAIAIDTNALGDFITQTVNNDTTLIFNADSSQAIIVDSLSCAPTGSEPNGYKYLVCATPTGAFASHANDIAEKIGGVWNFTDAECQQQLIVDNARTYETYQFNCTIWVRTSILWRVNGNRGLGANAFIGRPDQQPMYIRAGNKVVAKFDTARDLSLPKYTGLESGNFYFKPGINGKIDTSHFTQLVAGTNITIAHGPADTISATGGGASTNVYAPLVKSNDSISRRFTLKQSGDGIYDTSASMSSTSQVITTAHSIFASTDVGKVIVVMGAGTSGRDLVGTITTYTSATQVTISATAATTITAGRGKILFGTDRTADFQNTIIACFNAGGGDVFLPLGNYIINGALVSPYNSQIYIPAPATTWSSTLTHIRIIGEGAPNYSQYGVYSNGVNGNLYTGTNIISTQTSYTAGSTVIGTKGAVGFWGSYNYTYLTVENLTIKVLDNPGGAGPVIGGISYKNGSSLITNNVYIENIGEGFSSVRPTNDVVGIETPDDNSEAMNVLNNTLVTGIRTAYKCGEQIYGQNVQAFVCYYALNKKGGTNPCHFTKFVSDWCVTDVYVTGTGLLTIDLLQHERANPGNGSFNFAGKWFLADTTIKDTANLARGYVFYNMNDGAGTTNDNLFLMSGGATFDAKTDTTPYATGGRIRLMSAGSNKTAGIQNTNANGAIAFGALNSDGLEAFMGSYGNNVGSPVAWRSKSIFGSTGDLFISSSVGSGGSGTNPVYIYTGGESSSFPTAKFTGGDPGNVIIPGKMNVGSTATPSATLEVNSGITSIAAFNSAGAGNATVFWNAASGFNINFSLQNGGANEWYVGNDGTTNDFRLFNSDASGNSKRFKLTQAGILTLNAYGAGTATFDASGNISSVSDPRVKQDIELYNGGIAKLMQIHPITFRYNGISGNETQNTYLGFDAQNVFNVLGSLGTGVQNINGTEYKTLQDRAIIALLVNSVQQQQKEIDELKKEIKKQK